MSHILLVTLQSKNIGNRLQNYALQTVLQKMGYIVETPYYSPSDDYTLFMKIKFNIKYILGKIGVKRYRYVLLITKRKEKFDQFDKKYISNMFPITFDGVYQNEWIKYEWAVTGSDQVWHSWYNQEKELNYFYLEFMPLQKRVAYAPSFGFSEFPDKDREIHKAGLNNMQSLSCREKRGQELIYELTGRNAEVVLDPTLLLSAKEWKKIERKPDYSIEGGYILVYFLGQTVDYQDEIEKLAKEKKLHIIKILDINEEKYYCTSPDEFIWLIEHAEFVCTDSFHASVFSILFHRKFCVFRRKGEGFEDMFDRIESLLSMVGLEEQEYRNDIFNILNEVNWKMIEHNLDMERKKSMEYLCNSLKQ
ncbi:MAG: polysaccharide pyruvyl transferase family protein [Wujia sp.]